MSQLRGEPSADRAAREARFVRDAVAGRITNCDRRALREYVVPMTLGADVRMQVATTCTHTLQVLLAHPLEFGQDGELKAYAEGGYWVRERLTVHEPFRYCH